MRPPRHLTAAAAVCVLSIACSVPDGMRLPPPPSGLEGLDRTVRADFEELQAEARAALDASEWSAARRATAVGRLAGWYHLYYFEAAAEATYLVARDLDPQEPRWVYHLGRLYSDAGRLAEAREAVQQVLATREDYGPAHLLLAEIESVAGRTDEAGAAWRRALELMPGDPRALTGLGYVALQGGDSTEAIRLLQRAHDAQPEATEPRYLLGRALAAAGDRERAEDILSTLPTASEEQIRLRSVDPWVRELELAREGHNDHLAMAKAARAEGRARAALRHLEAAIAADEDNLGARLELAQTLAELHRTEAAVQVAEEAIRDYPDSPSAYRHLGTILARSGRLAEAETQLRRSLEIDPGAAVTHVDLAHTLRAQGRLDAALEAYAEAALLDPSSTEVAFWRGATLVLQGDPTAGRATVEKTLQQLPEDRRLGSLLARIVACGSSSNGLGPRSSTLAQRERQAPTDVFEAETRAMVLASEGRFAEAAAWEEAVLATLSRSEAPRFNTQIARQRRERYASGLACDQAWLASETISELEVSPPASDRGP